MEILLVEMPDEYIQYFKRATIAQGYNTEPIQSVFEATAAIVRKRYDVIVTNTTTDISRWQEFGRYVRRNNIQTILCAYHKEGFMNQSKLLDESFDILLGEESPIELHIKQIAVFVKRHKEISVAMKTPITTEYIIREGMTFYYEKSKVKVGHDSIDLTDSETRIIQALCEHRGNVVSRQELFETIYPGSKSLDNRRNIDVHVRNLREKIGSKCIRTVRGEGYLIE